MENPDEFAKNYSSQMATQMRKGLLGYFILLIAREPVYASDIIRRLDAAGVRVVEGRFTRYYRACTVTDCWHTNGKNHPVDHRANITT